MKILFIVTGIGLGDATRVHAVIEAIMKKQPKTKVLIAGYDNSFNYFRGKYPTIKIHGYRMMGRRMKFSFWSFVTRNFLLPFYWVYTAIKLKRSVKRFNPDIIISDFEPSGITIAKAIDKKCVAIFGFDPFLYAEYRKEHRISRLMALQARYLESLYSKFSFVIIPALGGRRRTLVYNYVNPILSKKFDKLPSKAKIMKELKLKKEPIVVMLGGSKFGMKLAKSIASNTKHFKNELFIAFGGEETKIKAKKFIHYPYSDEIHKYIKAAKAVITLGGQTTIAECIALKRPMLIYPIEDHIEQLLNAFAMEDYSMSAKFSEERLKDDIKEFLDILPELQKKMNKIKVKTNGAEQVAGLIRMLVLGK